MSFDTLSTKTLSTIQSLLVFKNTLPTGALSEADLQAESHQFIDTIWRSFERLLQTTGAISLSEIAKFERTFVEFNSKYRTSNTLPSFQKIIKVALPLLLFESFATNSDQEIPPTIRTAWKAKETVTTSLFMNVFTHWVSQHLSDFFAIRSIATPRYQITCTALLVGFVKNAHSSDQDKSYMTYITEMLLPLIKLPTSTTDAKNQLIKPINDEINRVTTLEKGRLTHEEVKKATQNQLLLQTYSSFLEHHSKLLYFTEQISQSMNQFMQCGGTIEVTKNGDLFSRKNDFDRKNFEAYAIHLKTNKILHMISSGMISQDRYREFITWFKDSEKAHPELQEQFDFVKNQIQLHELQQYRIKLFDDANHYSTIIRAFAKDPSNHNNLPFEKALMERINFQNEMIRLLITSASSLDQLKKTLIDSSDPQASIAAHTIMNLNSTSHKIALQYLKNGLDQDSDLLFQENEFFSKVHSLKLKFIQASHNKVKTQQELSTRKFTFVHPRKNPNETLRHELIPIKATTPEQFSESLATVNNLNKYETLFEKFTSEYEVSVAAKLVSEKLTNSKKENINPQIRQDSSEITSTETVKKASVKKVTEQFQTLTLVGNFTYKDYVKSWRNVKDQTTSPFVRVEKYTKITNPETRYWITFEHDFSYKVDAIAAKEGIKTKDGFHLVAEITMNGLTKRGVISYAGAVNPRTGTREFHHRCFTEESWLAIENDYITSGLDKLHYPVLQDAQATRTYKFDDSFADTDQKDIVQETPNLWVIHNKKYDAVIKIVKGLET